MSPKLILYNVDYSQPVRVVKVVAKLLGLELELRDVNLFEKEHLKEPFIKINPEHTVPTLVDGDFVIWDSYAICAYLVDKYGKDDSLYPKDLQLRARCDQRMIFNAASLFVRVRDCSIPIIYRGATVVAPENVERINAAFDILEAFLATDPFLVGQNLTIADIATALSVPYLEPFAPLLADKHPRILAWLNRVKQTIPFFEEMNEKYATAYRKRIFDALEKNEQN